MEFTVTKDGKPLSPDLYSWDKDANVFSSTENRLVLDFKQYNNVTFKVGLGCTFNTGYECVFVTGSNCTFNTGSGCTFSTGAECEFNTGYGCVFNTGYKCTFNTDSSCTFNVRFGCTFNVGIECVIVRRDVFDVIRPEPNRVIKLNGANIRGFEYEAKKHTITIDGKEIEMSDESYNALKKQLGGISSEEQASRKYII